MSVKTLAILGAGTMGGGIAISAAQAGIQTYLFDTNHEMLARAQDRATRYFGRLVGKGKLRPEAAEAATACLHRVTEVQVIGDADLVIEAIHEDLTAKSDLFVRLSNVIPPEAIVATNTSALRVSDLARSITHPGRFLGLHYFSPAEINPLVELVSGPETDAATVDVAERFLQKTGKTVLRCQDASGFAVNRFFCPYANEAVRVMDDGLATPAQIDAVVCAVFDLAMGPFAVMNIVKPKIMLNAVQNLSDLGPFYTPAAGLMAAGAGTELWQIAEDPPALSPEVRKTVEDRLCGAVWLPVLDAISEEVASPEDFDLGAELALRFGLPPVAAMRAAGREEVSRITSDLAHAYGQAAPDAGIARLFD